eukprot:3689844-Rhodomonas_salina.5
MPQCGFLYLISGCMWVPVAGAFLPPSRLLSAPLLSASPLPPPLYLLLSLSHSSAQPRSLTLLRPRSSVTRPTCDPRLDCVRRLGACGDFAEAAAGRIRGRDREHRERVRPGVWDPGAVCLLRAAHQRAAVQAREA